MLNVDMIVIHRDFASRDFFEIILTSSTELNSKEKKDMMKNQTNVVVRIVKVKEKWKKIDKCMWKNSWKKSQNIDVVNRVWYCYWNKVLDWLNFWLLVDVINLFEDDWVQCQFIWIILWIICLYFFHEIFLDNWVSNALHLISCFDQLNEIIFDFCCDF